MARDGIEGGHRTKDEMGHDVVMDTWGGALADVKSA